MHLSGLEGAPMGEGYRVLLLIWSILEWPSNLNRVTLLLWNGNQWRVGQKSKSVFNVPQNKCFSSAFRQTHAAANFPRPMFTRICIFEKWQLWAAAGWTSLAAVSTINGEGREALNARPRGEAANEVLPSTRIRNLLPHLKPHYAFTRSSRGQTGATHQGWVSGGEWVSATPQRPVVTDLLLSAREAADVKCFQSSLIFVTATRTRLVYTVAQTFAG